MKCHNSQDTAGDERSILGNLAEIYLETMELKPYSLGGTASMCAEFSLYLSAFSEDRNLGRLPMKRPTLPGRFGSLHLQAQTSAGVMSSDG